MSDKVGKIGCGQVMQGFDGHGGNLNVSVSQ